jgi:hypothetical protein
VLRGQRNGSPRSIVSVFLTGAAKTIKNENFYFAAIGIIQPLGRVNDANRFFLCRRPSREDSSSSSSFYVLEGLGPDLPKRPLEMSFHLHLEIAFVCINSMKVWSNLFSSRI